MEESLPRLARSTIEKLRYFGRPVRVDAINRSSHTGLGSGREFE